MEKNPGGVGYQIINYQLSGRSTQYQGAAAIPPPAGGALNWLNKMKPTPNALLLAVYCPRSRSVSFSFSFSPRRLRRIHLFSIRRFDPFGKLLLFVRDLLVRDGLFFLESIESVESRQCQSVLSSQFQVLSRAKLRHVTV